MKLSIIIPIFKAEKYLRECLESVRKSNIDDMECIMVNDESPDGSRDICLEFQAKDSRFILVDKKNGGVSSARNAGLKRASGEYVFFLDADDYLSDNAFEVIIKAMNDRVDFAAFSYNSLWDNGKVTPELFGIDGFTTDKKKLYELAYSDSCLNMCWGKLFLRSLVESNEMTFDETLPIGEDYKFVAEYVMNACDNVLLSNETIVFYRQHAASAMRKYNIEDRLKFTKTLYDFQRVLVDELEKREGIKIYMNNYYFRVLTNLCREFSAKESFKEAKNNIRLVIDSDIYEGIAKGAETSAFSKLKRFEYKLFISRRYTLATVYYRLKGKL